MAAARTKRTATIYVGQVHCHKAVPLAVNGRSCGRRLEPAAASGKPKVLLLTMSRCAALAEGLTGLGIEVVQAGSLRQAQRMLVNGLDVRAVLTDVALPDGDWRSVVNTVRARRANTEFVLLAPSDAAGLRRQAQHHGVYDVLTEPYSAGEAGCVIGGAVLKSYRRAAGISKFVTSPAVSAA
jgi:CheY-like chemotaxis protein